MGAEVTPPEPEVTSWQPEVTWFGRGHRGPGGKKGSRTQSPKSKSGIGERSLLERDQTKEDATLEENQIFFN